MPLHPFVVQRPPLFPRFLLIAAVAALVTPARVPAHCDTLDGPVVAAARTALDSGDVTLVLRWVPVESEAEIVRALADTREVRGLSAAARELADRWFFETVVRLHRASEGEPFTGVAPAGTPLDPAVAAADEALEAGNPDRLVSLLTSAVEAGVRERFRALLDARLHADESVPQGRALVAAYVELAHYAERLHAIALEGAGEHPESAPTRHEH